MRHSSRRSAVGFSSTRAAWIELLALGAASLTSCSDAATSPAAVVPGFNAPDTNSMGAPNEPADSTNAGATDDAVDPEAPVGSNEQVSPNAPLDNPVTDPSTSPTTEQPPAEPPVEEPPVEEPPVEPPAVPTPLVDCSQAGSAPITIAWDAIDNQAPGWYATPEALSLAENILYYRNDNRGWPKGIDMTTRTAPRGGNSTIDNNTTTTQIDYLARVYSATFCPSYGAAATAGIEYLLEAQYESGGWPQIYPNATGYSTHITYNDNAMVHVLDLLRQVSSRADHYAFAGATLAASATAAVESGIDCILATQIVINGTKTGWCAQHDEVTLAPAQARTYELPSLSGSEGANLLAFLMTIDNPSPEVRQAVNAAAAWFTKVAISGIRIQSTVDATQPTGEDRVVVQDPAAPLLWARFYELGTDRPIFSSRCEVAQCDANPFFMRRYSLAEIDNERRVGYSWYGNWGRQLLATTYPAWRARWGE